MCNSDEMGPFWARGGMSATGLVELFVGCKPVISDQESHSNIAHSVTSTLSQQQQQATPVNAHQPAGLWLLAHHCRPAVAPPQPAAC